MTTPAKVILGILVLILIALGAYYFSQNGTPAGTLNGNPSAPTAQTSNTNTTAEPASNPQDNNDAALNQAAANVDAQMNGFGSDNAAVNSGLNDKPVAQ